MYALDFRQLAYDISWDEVTHEVKDLLLTMLNLPTLSQTIVQVVHCDNMFFEHQQQKLGSRQ